MNEVKRLQQANNFITSNLLELGFSDVVISDVIALYAEKNRTYHNSIHVLEMYEYIIREGANNVLTMNEWDAIRLAIIFHDVIYNTKSKTNEEDSYKHFHKSFTFGLPESIKDFGKWVSIIPMVEKMIMATKEHKFSMELPNYVQMIIKADLERLTGSFDAFWNNTKQLMREYAFVDWVDFKEGRLKFFENYANRVVFMGPSALHNINQAYHTLKVWEPKIAVYPGSFNPFHVGHLRILERAEKMFDKVIIARGVNPDKKHHDRVSLPKQITDIYQIDEYHGLLTDYLKSKSYPLTVIRGLRSGMDLHGEITQYRYLQDLMPEIQLVNIFTDADVEHVSSSGIRALKPYFNGQKTQYELE